MTKKNKLGLFFVGIYAVLLSSCTSASFFIANFPTNIFSDQKIEGNISYGTEDYQKLNIYLPDKLSEKTPVIIFLYGGGWSTGNKDQYKFVADAFTSEDYIFVIPDYVKYPEGKFPQFEYDTAKAISWVKNNISKYSGDTDNIYLMGHSAGAYMGAMALADDKYLAEYNLKPKAIKAFIGLSGPYNFTPEEERYKKVFAEVSNDYDKMHVNTYVNGAEPPMLLIHGAKDNIVQKANMYALEKALKKENVKVQTKLYKDFNHIDTISNFSRIYKTRDFVKNDILDFLMSIR